MGAQDVDLSIYKKFSFGETKELRFEISSYNIANRAQLGQPGVPSLTAVLTQPGEAQAFGQGLNFFHVENWYSIHSVIRNALRLAGLYGRGLRNAERVELRNNDVKLGQLPPSFDGFSILHISDMHADMNQGAMSRLIELVNDLHYDICVLTGDFRGKTFGPFDATLDGVARVRSHLTGPVFGVLGNHDNPRIASRVGMPRKKRSRLTLSVRGSRRPSGSNCSAFSAAA